MSELVDLFLGLVQIDSESGDEEKFILHMKGLLERDLKAACSIDDFGNLLAEIPGKNTKKTEPILISCHGDTVRPGKGIKPVVRGGTIYSSGDTILGSDDKAGIAEAVWALKTAEKHPSVEFLITREEENGLKGARNFDVGRLKSKMGFLLDSGAIEELIVGGPCKINFDVEFLGKAAHSGLEPEKGISAIQAAAFAISKMRLGRIDDGTTANIGVIKGGVNRNGVPDKCSLLGEVRGLASKDARTHADHMEGCLRGGATKVGAKVEIKRDEAYDAVMLGKDEPVLEIARKAIGSVGLKPKEIVVGGGTDGSIYNAKGIPTVVMGVGQRKEHTLEEHIEIADMETAVRVLSSIFAQCA